MPTLMCDPLIGQGHLTDGSGRALWDGLLPLALVTSGARQRHIAPRVGNADTGRFGPSVAHGEEPPGARNTLEFVLTFVLETQVRASNQVDDCPGHKDLAWLGSALHTLSQMHGYAGYVFTAAF